VRGQLVETAWPAGVPPLTLYHDHGYVLPRGTHAILGSTMEHVGFDARVTPEGVSRIVRDAARLMPQIATLPIARSWAGLRPVTPDGLPIIGADPECEGLWYATGHGRNGILLAPLTGDIVADLLVDGRTALTDLEPLRADRFSVGDSVTAPPATGHRTPDT
jgi:glycine oxidase